MRNCLKTFAFMCNSFIGICIRSKCQFDPSFLQVLSCPVCQLFSRNCPSLDSQNSVWAWFDVALNTQTFKEHHNCWTFYAQNPSECNKANIVNINKMTHASSAEKRPN